MRLIQWSQSSRSLTKAEVDVFYNAPLHVPTLFAFKTKAMDVPTHSGALSLKMVLSGEETYKFGARTARVTPGQLLLIDEGQAYSSLIEEETESVSIFLPDGDRQAIMESFSMEADFLGAKRRNEDVDVPQAVFPADGPSGALTKRVLAAMRADNQAAAHDYSRLLFVSAMKALMGSGPDARFDGYAKKSTRDELLQRLLRAKSVIDETQGQCADLERLADAACLSKYYFLRLFTKVFGVSPAAYARRIRLATARRTISGGGDQKMAAGRAGYRNMQAFRRALKRVD